MPRPDNRADQGTVNLTLNGDGRPTGAFHWQVAEPRRGHTWDVTGRFRTGDTGVEILELQIQPGTSLQTNRSQTPPITFSTLKELQLSPLRASIASELVRLRELSHKQVAGLRSMGPPDDHWDSIDHAQYTEAWEAFAQSLDQSAATATGRRTSGGRPPTSQAEWARRAELALAALQKGGGIAYKTMETEFPAAPDTVPKWLNRMRRPLDPKDLGTGWLQGTGAGTMPGARLLAWRDRHPTEPDAEHPDE